MTFATTIEDPIPPEPDPVPPGPEQPQPVPPVPSSEPPWPDPTPEAEPRPDDDLGLEHVQSDVLVEVRGSLVVLSGVVESVEDRARIVDQFSSLTNVSRVEDNLRPPAA